MVTSRQKGSFLKVWLSARHALGQSTVKAGRRGHQFPRATPEAGIRMEGKDLDPFSTPAITPHRPEVSGMLYTPPNRVRRGAASCGEGGNGRLIHPEPSLLLKF